MIRHLLVSFRFSLKKLFSSISNKGNSNLNPIKLPVLILCLIIDPTVPRKHRGAGVEQLLPVVLIMCVISYSHTRATQRNSSSSCWIHGHRTEIRSDKKNFPTKFLFCWSMFPFSTKHNNIKNHSIDANFLLFFPYPNILCTVHPVKNKPKG